jgi:hypothetical protein
MDQLRRAIQDDTEPEISGKVMLGTLALCQAAYGDTTEGKAVTPQAMPHETVGR